MTQCVPASPNASPLRSSRHRVPGLGQRLGDDHALAGRQAVGLDDVGPGRVSRNASASSTCGVPKAPKRAVGTPASTRISFIHALELSSLAPSAPGPNTRLPWARSRSAKPSTRGTSGPITNRSASSCSGGVDVEPGIPGLPGVTTTSAVRPSTCSQPRAPAPRPHHHDLHPSDPSSDSTPVRADAWDGGRGDRPPRPAPIRLRRSAQRQGSFAPKGRPS